MPNRCPSTPNTVVQLYKPMQKTHDHPPSIYVSPSLPVTSFTVNSKKTKTLWAGKSLLMYTPEVYTADLSDPNNSERTPTLANLSKMRRTNATHSLLIPQRTTPRTPSMHKHTMLNMTRFINKHPNASIRATRNSGAAAGNIPYPITLCEGIGKVILLTIPEHNAEFHDAVKEILKREIDNTTLAEYLYLTPLRREKHGEDKAKKPTTGCNWLQLAVAGCSWL